MIGPCWMRSKTNPVVLNARYPAGAGGKHVGELIPGCARRLVLKVVRTEFACLSTRLAAGSILLKARDRTHPNRAAFCRLPVRLRRLESSSCCP